YIDHGDVLTSAGTASGLDACLHLVRSCLGATAASTVARSLVIAPHREGGQAQYIERPLPEGSGDDPISRTLEWVNQRLNQPMTISRMASAARMSTPTFVRAFRAATGTTPASWVRALRLHEARRMFELTDASVETIAEQCGFGSAVTLRQNFSSAFATTPAEYRRHFRARPRVEPQSSGSPEWSASSSTVRDCTARECPITTSITSSTFVSSWRCSSWAATSGPVPWRNRSV